MTFFGLFIFALVINYSVQTFVDLGHEVNSDVPLFPIPGYLQNKFKLTVLHNETTKGGFWIAYNSFCTVEHVSTHIDAPYHFYEHGWTVGQIPLEHLIAPAVVIDVTAKAAEDPYYHISAEDVENWVAENGVFPNNSVIIGRTGWSKKFNDPVAYLGDVNDYKKLKHPGFGIDAVRRILNYKTTDDIHVVGFGIDNISLDGTSSRNFEAHQAVQTENIYIIENMNNLEVLPPKGATLFVMPMKITDGTGAPTRVIAQLPPTEESTTSAASSVSSLSDADAVSTSSADTEDINSSSHSSSSTTTTEASTTTTAEAVSSEPTSSSGTVDEPKSEDAEITDSTT